jgi:hypothetical protein
MFARIKAQIRSDGDNVRDASLSVQPHSKCAPPPFIIHHSSFITHHFMVPAPPNEKIKFMPRGYPVAYEMRNGKDRSTTYRCDTAR